MKSLRVFISSPGDVLQERLIAKKVITELNQIYANYVRIEPIMWEDLPLEATSSFQQGIDYFLKEAPIDIAIFILWSRLGSTLGRNFVKSDGTVYRSGTEYEYDTMYELWKQTGHPKIMVYVKDVERQYGSKGLSISEIKENLSQNERLRDFIEEKFRDRETGTNYAYWQFDKQSTFEERLKTHLSRLVREHLGKDVVVKEWEGNPYLGLHSFGIKESIIFCGRRELAYNVLNDLMPTSESSEIRSLLVLGESGSGKSSFVMAGLLPLIYSNDATLLQDKVFRAAPSDFHGSVYSGLYEMVRKMHPELEGNPALEKLKDSIPENYDCQYLQYALKSVDPQTAPTLILDQFEEMFSDSSISEDERVRALALIDILVQTRRVRVVIIMRNDFYSKFTTYQSLGATKNAAVVVDIPNVSVGALAEIVEEPARKANIQWEINEKGQQLNKVVVQDASNVNSLPLIEFALSELYRECADSGKMTFEAYLRIGRIEGAVMQYANRFYFNLTQDEKQIFSDLLSSVITVSHETGMKYVRKTSLRSSMAKTPAHEELIAKLISAHLFTSGKDVNGEATVTIAHEILIGSWSVVKDWISREADFIKQNNYYERLAKRWDANGRKKKDLILERSALLEAEYFVFKNEPKLHQPAADFLKKSLLTQRRKGLPKYIALFLVLVLLVLCGAIVFSTGTTGDSDMDEAIGMNGLSMAQYLCAFLPLVMVVGVSTILRIFPRYKYKTIKTTAIIWTGVLLFVIATSVYEVCMGLSDLWFSVIIVLIYLVCSMSIFLEWRRRKLWRKSVFKPYLLADGFEKVRDISVAIVSVLFLFVVVVLYAAVIEEKNEQYEKTLAVADQLFNGLDNISDRLTRTDNVYVSQMRKNYLEERFRDALLDTMPDEREFEYALCLYNLHEPNRSLEFLYPNHIWKDHLMWVYCTNAAGYWSLSENALELFLDAKIDASYNNRINIDNLVWIAEKLGRFDLALDTYTLLDSISPGWVQNPIHLVNRGHIELMNGNFDEAGKYYAMSEDVYKQLSGSEDVSIIRESVEQDMQVFKWLNVGNQDNIDSFIRAKGFTDRHLYTHRTEKSDVFTSSVVSPYEGEWVDSDSTVILKFTAEPPMCQYRFFSAGDEINRMLTNLRCEEYDGHLYMDEFNQNADAQMQAISTGEILPSDNPDELLIRIVDNGNDAERGTVRRYTRYVTESRRLIC